MSLKFSTLQEINLVELTATWNRCWQGYFYDMNYSPEQMQGWLNLGQINLSNSLAIKLKDKIIGFSLMAIDDKDGWIAGTSIDPEYRRQGLFKQLLKVQIELAKKNLKLERIYLEVLIQNHARKAYNSVGFSNLRLLHIYRTGQEVNEQAKDFINLAIPGISRIQFTEVELEDYFKARRYTNSKPAWQRRESYLSKYHNRVAFLSHDSNSGALFANKQCTFLLDAWSSTLAGASSVLCKIRQLSGRTLSIINQPEDMICSMLSSWDIAPVATQLEMRIVLQN